MYTTSLNTSSLIKVLEGFRKKFPGKLKLHFQSGRLEFTEVITYIGLDPVWKEPAIKLQSGATFKFVEVYGGILIEDYYGEPCYVLRYDKDYPDEIRFHLNIPLHNYKDLCRGSIIMAYLPEIKPWMGNIPYHTRIVVFREDFETLYSATDPEKVLSCFSQCLQYIADYFIYPDGSLSQLDSDNIYGEVVSLIIL